MSRSGPPVLTPPPFIFLGALATGMALQAVWPLRLGHQRGDACLPRPHGLMRDNNPARQEHHGQVV